MNILLTNNYEAKISDFGLSKTKIVSSSQSKQGVTGTLRRMAPELLLQNQKYSEQSDIYALGMTIWEMAAKCTVPFNNVDYNLVALRIISGVKETIPNDTPQNIYYIIKGCWKDNSQERINLDSILKRVKDDELNSQAMNSLLDFQNQQFQKSDKEINEHYEISKPTEFSIRRIHKMWEENQIQKWSNNKPEWTNINPNLTSELIQSWQNHNFTYQQTQEWINIGMNINEANFCAWLRDTKNLTSEQVLNHHNLETLKQEFQTYQLQAQIQQANLSNN